jgi:predicted transcriptional regulator
MTATTTTIRADPASELRAAREEAGVTRAELARLAGCSLTFLANVEQGAVPHHSPTLDRVRAVLAQVARAGGAPT